MDVFDEGFLGGWGEDHVGPGGGGDGAVEILRFDPFAVVEDEDFIVQEGRPFAGGEEERVGFGGVAVVRGGGGGGGRSPRVEDVEEARGAFEEVLVGDIVDDVFFVVPDVLVAAKIVRSVLEKPL